MSRVHEVMNYEPNFTRAWVGEPWA